MSNETQDVLNQLKQQLEQRKEKSLNCAERKGPIGFGIRFGLKFAIDLIVQLENEERKLN